MILVSRVVQDWPVVQVFHISNPTDALKSRETGLSSSASSPRPVGDKQLRHRSCGQEHSSSSACPGAASQRIQYLHSVGLLRASFRPATDICAVRSPWRHRSRLLQMASERIPRMQKSLSQMNLQIHHVRSDLTGARLARLFTLRVLQDKILAPKTTSRAFGTRHMVLAARTRFLSLDFRSF